jgi:GntR family transcriptional regulator
LLIVVDSHSGVPVYRQIVGQVRFQVAAGLAPPGTELPSTRALSQALGVNPMTVSKAYGLLEEEGLVVRRPGLPLVVGERTAAAATAGRRAQLLSMLEPVAVAVRQLGLGEEEAIEVFRAALEAAPAEESHV